MNGSLKTKLYSKKIERTGTFADHKVMPKYTLQKY